AHSPMLNIIGDHATSHRELDAPLASDIAALARPLCDWLRTSNSPEQLARDGAEAVRAARTPPGRIAGLILPADVSWGELQRPPPSAAGGLQPAAATPVDDAAIAHAAAALASGAPTALLLNGPALSEP